MTEEKVTPFLIPQFLKECCVRDREGFVTCDALIEVMQAWTLKLHGKEFGSKVGRGWDEMQLVLGLCNYSGSWRLCVRGGKCEGLTLSEYGLSLLAMPHRDRLSVVL